MNDEFLYRLREAPPRDFALRLKERLDRQGARRRKLRSRYLHGLGIALLLGGAAYAISTGKLGLLRSADVEPQAAGTAQATQSDEDGAGASATPNSVPTSAARSSLATEPVEVAPRSGAPVEGGVAPAGGRAPAGARAAPLPATPRDARGAALRDSIRIAGTPGTEPHTERVVGQLERSFQPALRVTHEVQPREDIIARLCEIASAHIVVTFGRITEDEWADCKPNVYVAPFLDPPGTAFIELEIGYEAAVLARSVLYGSVDLPARALMLAFAKEVPDPRGLPEVVPNPYRTWYEIDPALALDRLEVAGPPLDTRAARTLVALLMEPGCRALAPIVASEVHRTLHGDACVTVRDDGVYAGQGSSLSLVRWLQTHPTVFGVLSGNEYLRVRGDLAAATIDGVAPTVGSMADGSYLASRALYVYAMGPQPRPDLGEVLARYLRLPDVDQSLVAPDESTRREMFTRAGAAWR